MELARACIPYTPLKRPLSECRVALLTTAGVYVDGTDPFEEDDLTWREISAATPSSALRIISGHFDVTSAEKDPNCVFPIDRLAELVQAGDVGKVADYHVSMGFTQQLRKLKEEVCWKIAEAVGKTRPDLVVLTGG